MGITFSLTCLAWIFFRSENISKAVEYLSRLFQDLNFKLQFFSIERYNIELLALLLFLLVFEWFHRTHEQPFVGKFKIAKVGLIVTMIIVLGVFSDHKDFIYFQF